MSDLFFSESQSVKTNASAPLAARMAPRTFDEFYGQEDIFGPGKLLRRAVEAGRLGSAIFFGPPGTGKTAAAKLAASLSDSAFVETNAVTCGVADIRKIVSSAKLLLSSKNRRTTLLLDEIHHFNRTQQDALLPDVERGVITLVGLTTENPYFYINPALISRANVFEFKRLRAADLGKILSAAMSDKDRGYGLKTIELAAAAASHLTDYSAGDARRLLNALELAVETTPPRKDGVIVVDLAAASEVIQKKPVLYDKSADAHYDHASAFIKSMRGSDPDAAIYWMSKMLSAGEDPRFLARRVVILAAEDVGTADPQALVLAVAALNAVEFVGMPEARIPLAEAVAYVSTAPKSNAAYLAVEAAMSEVARGPERDVPIHLKDSTADSDALGHGLGYKYPHDFPHGFVTQEYMPVPKKFYDPKETGFEREIKKRIDFWNNLRKNAPAGTDGKKSSEAADKSVNDDEKYPKKKNSR
ncbi:MAG: AAA family ATPase [Elusimicrobia bacterium HGW-Elusimicrobia-1]|jgi:putative ATPase|nr:MAG: AAA family ATPase [Elusimicrobia bacterium HGW-Elusimicrobia-1]